MPIRTRALARLISDHGVKLIHRPPQPAAADTPWAPDATETRDEEVIEGVIQRIRAETNPSLPAGSMKAVAVLKLPREISPPMPGDHLHQGSRTWTIETILPLVEDRQAVLVEAVLLTSGETP